MWIALEKSHVYAGLQDGVTEEQFLRAIKDSSVDLLLKHYVLEKGESLFIPAGLVHAICGDSLLLEIQQNSNTTYRLYDWGRVGRELHLDKGLTCIKWDSKPEYLPANVKTIISNSYFDVYRQFVKGDLQIESGHVLFCVAGHVKIGNLTLRKGQTCTVPCQSLLLGEGELIVIRLSEISSL